MSYLLEALRKSERERQQKTAVPDLQTPTVEWESGDESRQRSPWLTVAVIAICLNTILLAVLVWRFGFANNDSNGSHDVATAPATNASASTVTPAMPPVIVVQQPAATNEAIVVRERPHQEPALITPNQSRAYESNAGSNRAASPSTNGADEWTGNVASDSPNQVKREPQNTAQVSAESANADASDNAGENASKDSSDANDATPSIHSLPLNIRQQLPMLTMNSHIYASNARDCFVMINGSAFGPGQDITAGLKLVAVVPEGAVLEFRGHRFLLPALGSFSP